MDEKRGKIVVRFIAAIAFISGLGALLSAFAGGALFGKMVLTGIGTLGSAALIVYGIVFVLLGIGLWTLHPWGRALALLLSWLCIGVAIFSLLLGLIGTQQIALFSALVVIFYSLKSLIAAIIAIWLLQFVPGMREFFKKAAAASTVESAAATPAPAENPLPAMPAEPAPISAPTSDTVEIVMNEPDAPEAKVSVPAKTLVKKSVKKPTKKKKAKKTAKKAAKKAKKKK